MAKKAAPKAAKKLSLKKETVKDLKVKKGDSVKGGAPRLSQPKTPCDPGCTPC